MELSRVSKVPWFPGGSSRQSSCRREKLPDRLKDTQSTVLVVRRQSTRATTFAFPAWRCDKRSNDYQVRTRPRIHLHRWSAASSCCHRYPFSKRLQSRRDPKGKQCSANQALSTGTCSHQHRTLVVYCPLPWHPLPRCWECH